jgi:hypothetical protein
VKTFSISLTLMSGMGPPWSDWIELGDGRAQQAPRTTAR